VTDAATADQLFATPRRPAALVDAALAFSVLAGSLLVLMRIGGAAGASHRLDATSAALATLASLPLLAWRRSPLGVLALTTAASAALAGLGYPRGVPLGPTVALFLLVASRDDAHPWTSRTTAAVAGLFAVHVAALGVGRGRFPATAVAIGALIWLIAWFAGERIRLRRDQIAELEARAVAEERARIARDLHDSAGHAINVIGIQAGAGRLLQDRDPAGTRAALETIERIARQTAGEIDRIVGGLRDGERDTAPPGVAGLDALVAQHRDAGLAVSLSSEGALRRLGAGVDRAVYRIVQEALTNAARHGAGAARVELAFGDAALDLVVTNPTAGAGAPRADGGHGLIGMRERATLLGGTLSAGRSGGAFRVHARLPYAC
jgi:signal transduction histidine kinase